MSRARAALGLLALLGLACAGAALGVWLVGWAVDPAGAACCR